MLYPSRPNLLFILTDQQRYDAVGYVNNTILTPNIDKLSAKSIKCSLAIVQSPQCQPSRASMMTGLYPDNIDMCWNETPISLKHKTIGNRLSEMGYTTGYFGKLHFDSRLKNHTQTANHFGYQHNFLTEDWMRYVQTTRRSGFNIGHVMHYHQIMQTGNKRENSSDYIGPWTGKLSDHKLQHEDVIYHRSANFIKEHRRSNIPFACFVSFNGPHPPYASPPPYNQMYDDADLPLPDTIKPTFYGARLNRKYWRNIISQYYGCISWIDGYIGKLVDLVDDNTLIIFTSDHGDILGDHGEFSKGIYAYEGNIRVPLVIRYPNNSHKAVASKYDHIVQHVDLLPTIMSILDKGIRPPLDGADLSDALLCNKKINQFAFSAIGRPACSPPRLYMIRTINFKYTFDGVKQQLFDLSKDPKENTNVANDDNYSQILISHKSMLMDIIKNKLKTKRYAAHLL